MIPKVIHYCWFGRNPLPPLAKKCLRSWKKHCKGYQIIRWDEDNFDISSAPLYVRQAYEAKKWAFVTDYVRLKVVHDHGGIYLDTDVQVIRSLNELLQHDAFFGFDNENYVATGLGFGAVAGTSILQEMMDDYKDIPFIREDDSMDLLACPRRNLNAFMHAGLICNNEYQILTDNVAVYPSECFCPKAGTGGNMLVTDRTYSIHHFSASWYSNQKKKALRDYNRDKKQKMIIKKINYAVHFPGRLLFWILGKELYEKLKGNR